MKFRHQILMAAVSVMACECGSRKSDNLFFNEFEAPRGITPFLDITIYHYRKGMSHLAVGKLGLLQMVKAFVLLVLFMIAPIVEIEAANGGDIIMSKADVEQSQGGSVVIFDEKFVDEFGYTIYVYGVNSKGETDNIDKIFLDIYNCQTRLCETYTVKSVTDRELYMLSSNGVKEGPAHLTHVVAVSQKSGELESFISPKMVNYVKALVAHSYNKTDIRLESDVNYIVYDGDQYCRMIGQQEIGDFSWPMKNTGNLENFGELIPSFTRKIQGSHGVYTIRLYKNAEEKSGYKITLQKEGEDEFELDYVDQSHVEIRAFDGYICIGTIFAIHTVARTTTKRSNFLTDDILGAALHKIWENNYRYFKIDHLGDDDLPYQLFLTPHGKDFIKYVFGKDYPYSHSHHTMYVLDELEKRKKDDDSK